MMAINFPCVFEELKKKVVGVIIQYIVIITVLKKNRQAQDVAQNCQNVMYSQASKLNAPVRGAGGTSEGYIGGGRGRLSTCIAIV